MELAVDICWLEDSTEESSLGIRGTSCGFHFELVVKNSLSVWKDVEV